MDGIVVRRTTAADKDAVVSVIGRAFADQPNNLAVTRGDRELSARMAGEGMRIVKFGRPYNDLWVAERDGRILGALNAVRWPHCQMGLGEKLRTGSRLIFALGTGTMRGMSIMRTWEQRDPPSDHVHLGPIGVDPDAQRIGVGTAMLRAYLEVADGEGVPTYLETDRETNLVFYERAGYRRIGDDEILGVRNWYMWRDVPSA